MTINLLKQLQHAASDSTVPVSSLLLKARLVASRLNGGDTPEWIDKEISGYEKEDTLPPYRMVRGQVVAQMVGRRVPVEFNSEDLESSVATREMASPVAEIESYIDADGSVIAYFPPEAANALREITGTKAQFCCLIPKPKLIAVLGGIRNRLLRWSMELERTYIQDESTFDIEDHPEKAHLVTIHNTGSLNIGNIGSIGRDANIANGAGAHAGPAAAEELVILLDEINKYLPSLAISAEDKQEVQVITQELSLEISSKNPKPSKISNALKSVKKLVGKGAETVVTAGITALVDAYMRKY